MRGEAPKVREERRLEPWLHTAFDGIPYFDEELQVPHSTAHRIMVGESVPIFAAVAEEARLLFRSDEPIWYLHPETAKQKAFYGDLVLARPVDPMRVTAEDLLLVMEVVSTQDRRKMLRDMLFQRVLNEYNDVPEFALVFPDVEDLRALTFYRLGDEGYEAQIVAPGGRVRSSAVPGLELAVLPRERWSPGYKLEIYYRGELRPRLMEVAQLVAKEKARAEQEKARAEQQKARAEQEKARAEQEKARAEQEKARAEQEKARAEHEKARAEQEKARADRLAERLRELGIDLER